MRMSRRIDSLKYRCRFAEAALGRDEHDAEHEEEDGEE
jgi:hypothetical protein